MLKLLGGGTDLVKNPENKSVASDTETITTNKTNDAEDVAGKTAESNAVNNASEVMVENNAVNDTAQNAVKNAVKDAKIVKTVAMPSAEKKAAGNVSGEKMGAQNADKNTATQSFNVEKNKDVVNANQLKVLKVDTQNTYAWDDTSDAAMIARGYHKTAAGWTKLQQGKDYDAIATHTEASYTGGNDNADYVLNDENANGNYIFTGNLNLDTTINKDDTNKKKVLLLSVPVLTNDDAVNPGIFFDSRADMSVHSQQGTVIGKVTTEYSNDELNYFYVPTTSEKFANDISFKMNIENAIARYGNGFSEFKNHTVSNPYRQKLITNDGSVYQYRIRENLGKINWIDKNNESIDNWMSNDTKFHFVDYSGIFADSSKPWYPIWTHRVLKLSSANGNPISEVNSTFTNDAAFQLVNKDGKISSNRLYHSGNWFTSIRLADDLTPDEVYQQAESNPHHVSYSMQKDGSVLIGSYMDGSEQIISEDQIRSAFKKSSLYLSVSPEEAKEIEDSTVNFYKNRNWHPLEWNYCTNVNYQDYTKPEVAVLSDVTPSPNYKRPDPITSTYSPSQTSVDVSMYRNINVIYRDEITGKEISRDVLTGVTGKQMTYNIKRSDNYQLAPGQATVLTFTVNDNNPDKIINILGKEDYERDRTYTVVTQKPDHNGGTTDNTYATYTMKMTRNVTGRDGSGKVTFDDWKMTDGNGVTYTYDPTSNAWTTSNGSKVTDIVLGATTDAPKDADFAVDGYTAHSDIAIDGIDLPNFADKLANPKDKIEITQNGQLLIHTSDFANPDKTLPSGSFYIKYIANPQKVVYQFIDDDNNKQQFGSDIVLNGVTDQTVATGLKVPANYYVASGASVPASYKFGATNQSPIEIHLKHVLTDITDQARLHGESTRTFYITYPNGRKPETIIQIVGVARTGQHDTVTGQDSFTAWVLDSSASKVTVNGQDSTNYAAYDPSSKTPRFASITLPRIPGYTAEIKQNLRNKMMYLVSFVAIPTPNTPNKGEDKGDGNKTTVDQGQTIVNNKGQDKIHDNGRDNVMIDVPSDNKDNSNETVIPSTPSIINTDNNKENNKDEHDWTINSIKSNDYVVSNGVDDYTLPMIGNTGLSIIKTSDNTLAFTYIRLNTPSDYVFTLTKRRNMYQLKIDKVVNGKLTTIKTFKSHNYKDLMKELKKMYL